MITPYAYDARNAPLVGPRLAASLLLHLDHFAQGREVKGGKQGAMLQEPSTRRHILVLDLMNPPRQRSVADHIG